MDDRQDHRTCLRDDALSLRAKHVKSYLAWRRTRRLGAGGVRKHDRRCRNSDKVKAEPKPVTNRTLVRDRAVLHRLFALVVRRELLHANAVALTQAAKADARDPTILVSGQLKKLLTACGDRPMLRLFVLLFGETGMRCESEALWLRWEDVDPTDGFLWIASRRAEHRTKSGKGRWAPLTMRLTEAIKAHAASYRMVTYEGERSPWLFHHEITRRKHKAGGRIRRCATASLRPPRAGLPDSFRQHDLRHRPVTQWLAEGQSAALVQEAMSHSDLRTTLGYSHLARTHLKALVSVATKEKVTNPQHPEHGRSGSAMNA